MAAATPPTHGTHRAHKKCHSVSIAWTSGAATATATATEDPHPLLRIQDCRVAVPRSWGTGSRDFVPSVGLTISCCDFCRQLRKGKHAVPQNTLSTHPEKRNRNVKCQKTVTHASWKRPTPVSKTEKSTQNDKAINFCDEISGISAGFDHTASGDISDISSDISRIKDISRKS